MVDSGTSVPYADVWGWNDLSDEQQDFFLSSAKHLLANGFFTTRTERQLAEDIFAARRVDYLRGRSYKGL